MGIGDSIRRFLAGGGPPQTQEKKSPIPSPREEEGMTRDCRLETEAFLDPVEPEAERPVREVNCPIMVFGKVVQRPGGPIEVGSEHDLRYTSLDFPETRHLYRRLQNYYFKFLQVDSESILRALPWKADKQAIIKATEKINGKDYVICYMSGFHSERGSKEEGRLYKEARMIAVPVSEWSVALIPQLPKILDNTPLTQEQIDKRSPENKYSTELLDEELPTGWFDNLLEAYIAHVVGGRQVPVIADKEKNTSDEFLKRVFHTSICLPESIARQTSIGANLLTVDGRLRFGHGYDHTLKKEKDDEKRKILAEYYVDKLRELLTGCKTPRDVMKKVNAIDGELIKKLETQMFGHKIFDSSEL